MAKKSALGSAFIYTTLLSTKVWNSWLYKIKVTAWRLMVFKFISIPVIFLFFSL